MITCNMRNASAGPIRIKVEEMRDILNNRTNDDGPTDINMIFARLSQKGIRCGGVPFNSSDKKLNGTLSLKILYGGIDEVPSRQYTLKLNIQVIIDAATQQIWLLDSDTQEIDATYRV